MLLPVSEAGETDEPRKAYGVLAVDRGLRDLLASIRRIESIAPDSQYSYSPCLVSFGDNPNPLLPVAAILCLKVAVTQLVFGIAGWTAPPDLERALAAAAECKGQE